MNWRPDNWDKVVEGKYMHYGGDRTICETGADEILEALKPRLEIIYAQLNGIRMKEGKTSWYSALDASIDELKGILNIKIDDD